MFVSGLCPACIQHIQELVDAKNQFAYSLLAACSNITPFPEGVKIITDYLLGLPDRCWDCLGL